MNLPDQIVSYFSPEKALKRAQARKILAYTDSHKGSSLTSQVMRNWLPAIQAPNVEMSRGVRKRLTARSRDADRNQPIARAAVDRTVLNAVGTGLKLEANVDHEVLGLTEEQANEKEREIERKWKMWSEDPAECDYEKDLDFSEMQALVCLSGLVSGDCFANTPNLRRKNGIFETKVQIIEADRVCNPHMQINSETLIDGVEIAKDGSHLYYHIAKAHPADWHRIKDANEWEKIPVWGSKTGRRRVIQVKPTGKRRPGMVRSEPLISPVMQCLKQIDNYSESELVAAVISSYFTVFVESELTGDETFSQNKNETEDYGEDYPIPTLGPGVINELKPGDSIKFANPGRPNSQFDPFIQSLTKQIGSALNIPYEVLIGHFSSSYSAARAALIEAWRFFLMRREHIANKFCRPIYLIWFDEMVARGIIECPGYADPFMRAAWTGSKWIGAARGQIDEIKAANAAEKRIKIGISSVADECLEIGKDPEQVFKQNVNYFKRKQEAGLINDFGEDDGSEEDDPSRDPEKHGDDPESDTE